jgi:hypothetical protein
VTENRKLNLPNAINEGQIKLLILDSFILLGEELGNHFDSKLSPTLGKNWVYELARGRGELEYNLTDPHWVLIEPLRNSTSPTRLTLPKGQGFYNQVSTLAKARNAYFHNNNNGSIEAALQVLQLLLEISLAVPLNLAGNAYADAIKRLNSLKLGEVFDDGESSLKRVELLEQQVADLEELANLNKGVIQSSQVVLEDALDNVALQQEKLRELEEKVGNKDQAIAQARKEKEAAEKVALELKAEYDAKVAELAAKEATERQYKELLKTLVESKTVESINSSNSSSAKSNAHDLKPGDNWPGEKGSRRLTLSVNFKELYDTKSGELLKEKFGEAASELAKEWLEIKPQGGRIFVDASGNATAYRGEDLVYLGKVNFWA